MNERIRALAEQAEFSARDLHIQNDNFQRFAELIVQECADVVADAVDHREPASTYVDKIRSHFGVE